MLLGLAATAARGRCADPATRRVDWGLEPSAVAIYDRFAIETVDGVEKGVGRESMLVTVRGHDLRDDGRYLPVTTFVDDLSAIFGFRLPRDDAGEASIAFDPKDGPPVEGRGSVREEIVAPGDPAGGSTPGLVTSWTFASKGTPARGETVEFQRGLADVQLRWTAARDGPPETSRVRLRYRRVPLVRDPKQPPHDVDETFEFRLREVRRGRNAAFTKEVAKALDAGVAWIRRQQRADGAFPPHENWSIGTTALALLTLAECDVARDDPDLARGLVWLTAQAPTRTYDRALALMALERAYTPPSEEALISSGRLATRIRNLTPERRAWAEGIAAALEASAVSPGSFGYPSARNARLPIDSSNTQYAALGLRAASRLSIPTKDTTWLGIARHFGVVRERRGPRGDVVLTHEGDRKAAASDAAVPARPRPLEILGFLYAPEDEPTGSMTSAGIACLELARHELLRARSPRLTPAFEAEIEERVRSGWAWLDRHWGVDRHPEKREGNWNLYFLYALERAAVFSRVREVNGRDWYFEGATELLARPHAEGFWTEGGASDLVQTCFAVLFLKKATPPLTDTSGR